MAKKISLNKTRQTDSNIKAVEALRMRTLGHTYAEIAKTVGYASPSGAYEAVKKHLDATTAEMSDQLRQIEAIRLDSALQIAWQIANNEKNAPLTRLAAIDRIVKLQERRSKYYGLDTAQKHEHTIRTEIDAEIERLLEELGTTSQRTTTPETA